RESVRVVPVACAGCSIAAGSSATIGAGSGSTTGGVGNAVDGCGVVGVGVIAAGAGVVIGAGPLGTAGGSLGASSACESITAVATGSAPPPTIMPSAKRRQPPGVLFSFGARVSASACTSAVMSG